MSKALQKLPPAWHQEAKQLLLDNFQKIHDTFVDATKRAVWLGMFLNHVKTRGKEDDSIPHGQFGPWLKANVPDLNRDTIATYMRLATAVCEKGHFQISEFPKFAKVGSLPPTVNELVEGKTQQQLFLEFKQADDDEPEKPDARRGQLKGSKGLTKEMRARATERAEQERVNELEETIVENIDWLLEIADAKNLGAMEVKLLKKFAEAAETAAGFARKTIEARKGTA